MKCVSLCTTITIGYKKTKYAEYDMVCKHGISIHLYGYSGETKCCERYTYFEVLL